MILNPTLLKYSPSIFINILEDILPFIIKRDFLSIQRKFSDKYGFKTESPDVICVTSEQIDFYIFHYDININSNMFIDFVTKDSETILFINLCKKQESVYRRRSEEVVKDLYFNFNALIDSLLIDTDYCLTVFDRL